MNSTQVDVTVVYSDKGSRPVRRTVAGRARVGSHRSLALVGLLSFLMSGGMIYATWWPADHFIYMTFMMKTPVPGIDPAKAAMLFGIRPSADNSRRINADKKQATDTPQPRFVGETATTVIGASAYGWLTLSTMAACLLAMSAGAALSCAIGGTMRVVGVVLLVLGVVGLAIAAYLDWQEYGRHFPPSHTRFAMASLVALAMVLGLAIGRGVKGFFRVGSIGVIIAGIGTATALYLGGQCDAVSPQYCSLQFLLIAFAAHSAYGWILLFLGPKVAPA